MADKESKKPTYLRKESWGFSAWKDGKQYGAAALHDIEYFLPDKVQRRQMRKHGICALEM